MAELFRFLMNALFLFWLATSEKWINGKNNSYVGILDMRVNGKFTVYLHVPLYSALTLPSDSECESKSFFLVWFVGNYLGTFSAVFTVFSAQFYFSLQSLFIFNYELFTRKFSFTTLYLLLLLYNACVFFLSTPPAPVYLKTMFIQLQ